jgi:NitT/TauT family transport system ATP-binding protein
MVELEGLSVSYALATGSLRAVEGATALFPRGALTALIGPSGSGKTSLLKAVAGLLPASEGQVLVDGRVLLGVREKSAFIFQDSGLLPWKTVAENAELPLRIRGLPPRERREKARPILEELGLGEFAAFYPARLSGGMRQRLAVARALVQEADLLLMDEPFSSLDALTREGLQESLSALRRAHPLTIVLVTHSIEEAAFLADRVYIMAGRTPGRIAACLEWRVSGGAGGGGPTRAWAPAPRGGAALQTDGAPVEASGPTLPAGGHPVQSGSAALNSGALSVPSGALPVPNGALPVQSRPLPVPSGALSVQSGALSVQSGALSVQSGALSVPSGALPVPSGALSVPSGALSDPSGAPSVQSGRHADPGGAGPGEPSLRSSPVFFARCAELRGAFEAAVAAAGGLS